MPCLCALNLLTCAQLPLLLPTLGTPMVCNFWFQTIPLWIVWNFSSQISLWLSFLPVWVQSLTECHSELFVWHSILMEFVEFPEFTCWKRTQNKIMPKVKCGCTQPPNTFPNVGSVVLICVDLVQLSHPWIQFQFWCCCPLILKERKAQSNKSQNALQALPHFFSHMCWLWTTFSRSERPVTDASTTNPGCFSSG